MNSSAHFLYVIKERGINYEWVEQTLSDPVRVENYSDGTRHFLRPIPAYDNRWLRVVVNVTTQPEKLVTAFFDRRLRKLL